MEGLRISFDAYENGIQFDKLIISKNAKEKYSDDLRKLEEISKELYLVSDDLFKKISDTNSPQGIIALAKVPQNKYCISKEGKYIALENINDPSNLGAISRTAEALGVSGLIISTGSCDPYSPKSLRASMGTLLRMPLFLTEDITNFLKENNLKSYACVVDKNARKITDVSFDFGSAIIIGNEANGILKETKSNCDEQITIEMKGKTESLNAAVAASIAMWEMMK